MKKGLMFTALACALTMSLASCGSSEPQAVVPVATLSSIRVKQEPNKTEYLVGEAFDSTGLVVEAAYSDVIKKEVSDYTLSQVDMSTSGTK